MEIMQGFTRRPEQHEFNLAAAETHDVDVALDEGRLQVPQPGQWVSGDLHVHMNWHCRPARNT